MISITEFFVLLTTVMGAITLVGSEFTEIKIKTNSSDYEKTKPQNSPVELESFKLTTRSDWYAQSPISDLTDLDIPVQRVIIAHTATRYCATPASCEFQIRFIQTVHMEFRGWDDIGYNFLIGGDGIVYEGRGWDKQGAHTKGFNQGSICIAFIGNFNDIKPNEQELHTARLLIEEGVKFGKLSADYKLYGHRQLAATESPGTNLFNIIKTWEHWVDNSVNDEN